MDELLARLLTSAEERYDAARIQELKPFLEQAASDLYELFQHELDPSDGE